MGIYSYIISFLFHYCRWFVTFQDSADILIQSLFYSVLPGHPCLNFFDESDTPHPCRIPSVICRVPKNSNELDTCTRVGYRHPHPCPCNTDCSTIAHYTVDTATTQSCSSSNVLNQHMHKENLQGFLYINLIGQLSRWNLCIPTSLDAQSGYWQSCLHRAFFFTVLRRFRNTLIRILFLHLPQRSSQPQNNE